MTIHFLLSIYKVMIISIHHVFCNALLIIISIFIYCIYFDFFSLYF